MARRSRRSLKDRDGAGAIKPISSRPTCYEPRNHRDPGGPQAPFHRDRDGFIAKTKPCFPPRPPPQEGHKYWAPIKRIRPFGPLFVVIISLCAVYIGGVDDEAIRVIGSIPKGGWAGGGKGLGKGEGAWAWAQAGRMCARTRPARAVAWGVQGHRGSAVGLAERHLAPPGS